MSSHPKKHGQGQDGDSRAGINGGVAVPRSQKQSKHDSAVPGSSKQPPASKTGVANERGVSQTSTTSLNSNAAAFQPATTAPITFLNRGSTADGDQPLIVSSTGPSQNIAAPTSMAPIGPPNGGAMPSVGRATFTTDTGPGLPWVGGHYIRIANVAPDSYDRGMFTLHRECSWNSAVSRYAVTQGETTLSVWLCFNDVNKAALAEDEVALVNQDWQVSFVTHTEYYAAIISDHQKTDEPSSYWDGQVFIAMRYDGDMANYNADWARKIVRNFADDFGEVLAFTITEPTATQWEVRIEFELISVAHACLGHLKQQPVVYSDWVLVLQEMPEPGFYNEPDEFDTLSNAVPELASTPHKTMTNSEGRQVHFSPSGRTAWIIDDQGHRVPQQPIRRVPRVHINPDGLIDTPSRHMSEPMHHAATMYDPSMVSTRNGSHPGNFNTPGAPGRHGPAQDERHEYHERHEPSGPQVVRLDRLRDGSDVRTTVMLRNVPNTWGLYTFKSKLDVYGKYRYDFSYLRIDFEKGQNVGYAFVNFIDPNDIVVFYEHWVGTEWDPVAAPGKTVQMSYATTQGIDCLVEKFRNSSILAEFTLFQPKLWWTQSEVPHACKPDQVGTEKPFPPPNNMTKHRRSHDNAGAVGLYLGRGQQRQDRTRRSNWDRGTPRQLQEEAAAAYASGSPFNANYTLSARGPIGTSAPHFPAMYQPMPMPHPQFFPGQPFMAGYGGPYGESIDPFTMPPGMQYQQPMPPQQYFGQGAYGGFGIPPPAYNHQYAMMQGNPASRLRTITQGRLASRPRNVTVAPQGYCDAPVPGQARVPRSFMQHTPNSSPAHSPGYSQQIGHGQQHGYVQ